MVLEIVSLFHLDYQTSRRTVQIRGASLCDGIRSFCIICYRLLGVDLGHVESKINNTVGVAPLVVVPGDELDEIFVQLDSGMNVYD